LRFKTSPGKQFRETLSGKKTITKRGLVEWLKVQYRKKKKKAASLLQRTAHPLQFVVAETSLQLKAIPF
jgi:hypothetical protein